MKETTVKRGPEWPLTVAVYVVLFVFGAVQALVGSFQYSRVSGPVPVAALACCAAILATCVLAAWATRSTLAKVKSSAITARQPSVPNLICPI